MPTGGRRARAGAPRPALLPGSPARPALPAGPAGRYGAAMPLSCPSCRQPMTAETYPGHYGRTVQIDLCPRCDVLWFDRLENLALAPGSVLGLLERMAEAAGQERVRLADRLLCPRCDAPLRLGHRMTKDTRYEVAECPAGHGHLISFYNFLKEKGCVRPLRGEKLKALRAMTNSVPCSNCGAPVDLHRTTTCAHCGSPLALLDPDALRETLAGLRATAERRAAPVPEQVAADMILARLEAERAMRPDPGEMRRVSSSWGRHGLLETSLIALVKRLLR